MEAQGKLQTPPWKCPRARLDAVFCFLWQIEIMMMGVLQSLLPHSLDSQVVEIAVITQPKGAVNTAIKEPSEGVRILVRLTHLTTGMF